MAKTETLVNMLNAIRGVCSPTYKDRVPLATQENITAVGNPLTEYKDSMNEFLTTLINRIGLTLIRNKEFNNPLSILKQGGLPLGLDIQDIYVNPAEATEYNVKSTDLLSQTVPDVKSVYYRQNRRNRYCVTITKSDIKTAFTSFDSLDKLITGITNSLYSGNYIDEFLLCKNLFASAFENGKIKYTELATPTDEQTGKAFVKTLRNAYNNFKYPSSAWNVWADLQTDDDKKKKPVITWTNPEDIRVVITSEIESTLDVEVLASAFNMDKTVLLGNILTVDNFGVDSKGVASRVNAVIFDKTFTQIWDTENSFEVFNNPSNLTQNLYYHVWQTYATSPFANALAIVSPATTA